MDLLYCVLRSFHRAGDGTQDLAHLDKVLYHPPPPPALLQILQIAWRKVDAYQAAKGMAAASPPLYGPIQAGCFQFGASVSQGSNLPALAGRLLGFHLP